jgi:ribonuclease HI
MKGVFPPSSLYGVGATNDIGEEIERLFVPDYSPMHRHVPEAELITYSAEKQVSQLQLLHPRTREIELDKMTLVVSIDGACRENGTPSARASWGVFFGPGSRFNSSGPLSPSCPQTSSRAEIEALSQAIDAIRGICHGDMTLQEIKIRSDSEYLCQAMSMWVGGWIGDNGIRPNGQPVAHFGKLKEIHEAIDEMTYGDDGGLHFQFWHVPREDNREADALATSVLGG